MQIVHRHIVPCPLNSQTSRPSLDRVRRPFPPTTMSLSNAKIISREPLVSGFDAMFLQFRSEYNIAETRWRDVDRGRGQMDQARQVRHPTHWSTVPIDYQSRPLRFLSFPFQSARHDSFCSPFTVAAMLGRAIGLTRSSAVSW